MVIEMNYCVECFADKYLREFITERGSAGKCDFCRAANVAVIPAPDLRDTFEPLLELYSIVEIGTNRLPDEDPFQVGEALDDLIDQNWPVWSETFPSEQRIPMLEEIFGPEYDHDRVALRPDFQDLWTDRRPFYEGSARDSWSMFCHHLRHERRFIPKADEFGSSSPAEWLPIESRIIPYIALGRVQSA